MIEDVRDKDTRRLISDWAQFHGFEDDCGYPLISPSDVVLDDLAFRIDLKERHPLAAFHEIDREARLRWEKIPWNKGKERRLRRREPETDG
jgi:hypothetical protein